MFDSEKPNRMLLTPREVAIDVLKISEAGLWNATQPRGPIPCMRIGRSIRYSVKALEDWVADEQLMSAAAG